MCNEGFVRFTGLLVGGGAVHPAPASGRVVGCYMLTAQNSSSRYAIYAVKSSVYAWVE